MRLYVGNLATRTTPGEMTKLFGAFGAVVGLDVVSDPGAGRAHALVEMSSGGEEAVLALDGVTFLGRVLAVRCERPSREPQIRDGGGASAHF
jgi:RNA recognition motif-containing protein